MEEKEVISGLRVSFSGVKKGELAITQNDLLLSKRKSLFSSASAVKAIPLASLIGVQADQYKLKLDGNKESGEVFVETVIFEYTSEADKALKRLQRYLEEKARKTAAEEERKAREKEEARREQEERYHQYLLGNTTHLWSITNDLFRLCAAIPGEEWDNIKYVGDAIQTEVEAFLKHNSLDKDTKLPDFRELAEKEDLPDLEKASAALLEYVSNLLGGGPPTGTPAPAEGERPTGWEELKYFFLYAAILGEAGLLLTLDEPGELFQTAAKLEQLTPIIADKFGFGKDKSLVASLRLPKKHDEASAILKKLVSELEGALPKGAEGRQ